MCRLPNGIGFVTPQRYRLAHAIGTGGRVGHDDSEPCFFLWQTWVGLDEKELCHLVQHLKAAGWF
jgi:hypothetical protein